MPRQPSKVLAQRFGYADWRGANRLPEELLVWDFLPTIDLPGWELRDVREVRPTGAPRSVQSVWAPRGAGGGLLLLDVFECASRLEGHAFAIRLLGLFESPYVGRLEDDALGDVSFGDPDGNVRVFARGNLVVSVRPGDPGPAPVGDTAARLDDELVSKPEEPATRALDEVPAMRPVHVPARAVRVGAELELDVGADDPRGRRVWFKAFASTGTFAVSEGRPVYRHEVDAPPDVVVCAVAGPGAASRRPVELTDR